MNKSGELIVQKEIVLHGEVGALYLCKVRKENFLFITISLCVFIKVN